MELNASCVIGNHDHYLLKLMGYIKLQRNPEAIRNRFVFREHRQILSTKFDRKAAEWMLRCLYILRVGQANGVEMTAVHAGLFPGKPLGEQGTFQYESI